MRPLIHPARCAVRPAAPTATMASPSRPQATVQPSSALLHSRHSYRARGCPYRGGRSGGGPSAKRWAKRWSAHRRVAEPNPHGEPDVGGGRSVGGAGRAPRAEVQDRGDQEDEVEDRGAGQQDRARARQAHRVPGHQAGAEQAPEPDLTGHDGSDQDRGRGALSARRPTAAVAVRSAVVVPGSRSINQVRGPPRGRSTTSVTSKPRRR